jgi:hypothetical protein
MIGIKVADHVHDRAVERTDITPEEIRALRQRVRQHSREGTLDPNKDYRYEWRTADGTTRGFGVIGPVPHRSKPGEKLHVLKTILAPYMSPPLHELPAPTSAAGTAGGSTAQGGAVPGAEAADTPQLHHAKEAASRQVKELRKLHEAGDMEGVQRLARQLYGSGVQKDTAGGVQVRPSLQASTLGRGMEGSAVEVFGPHGVEVRKQFDPTSQLWSRQLRDDKANMLRAAQQNPETAGSFAKIYGAHETPEYAIHRMERVHGTPLKQQIAANKSIEAANPVDSPAARGARDANWALDAKVNHLKTNLDQAAQAAGVGHRDVVWHEPVTERLPNGQLNTTVKRKLNTDNIFVQPNGQMKVIDVLPTRPDPVGGVRPIPGNARPVPGIGTYFPEGIRPAQDITPAEQLARQLGPGSRQARKVRGAKGTGAAPPNTLPQQPTPAPAPVQGAPAATAPLRAPGTYAGGGGTQAIPGAGSPGASAGTFAFDANSAPAQAPPSAGTHAMPPTQTPQTPHVPPAPATMPAHPPVPGGAATHAPLQGMATHAGTQTAAGALAHAATHAPPHLPAPSTFSARIANMANHVPGALRRAAPGIVGGAALAGLGTLAFG